MLPPGFGTEGPGPLRERALGEEEGMEEYDGPGGLLLGPFMS